MYDCLEHVMFRAVFKDMYFLNSHCNMENIQSTALVSLSPSANSMVHDISNMSKGSYVMCRTAFFALILVAWVGLSTYLYSQDVSSCVGPSYHDWYFYLSPTHAEIKETFSQSQKCKHLL